jgi:hypothetical protein
MTGYILTPEKIMGMTAINPQPIDFADGCLDFPPWKMINCFGLA